MARINVDNLKKCDKERNSVHETVSATYTVFQSNGNKYLQIDTYGRDGRDNPGKVSQSLQFDKESARFFVDLLAHEFDLQFYISSK